MLDRITHHDHAFAKHNPRASGAERQSGDVVRDVRSLGLLGSHEARSCSTLHFILLLVQKRPLDKYKKKRQSYLQKNTEQEKLSCVPTAARSGGTTVSSPSTPRRTPTRRPPTLQRSSRPPCATCSSQTASPPSPPYHRPRPSSKQVAGTSRSG